MLRIWPILRYFWPMGILRAFARLIVGVCLLASASLSAHAWDCAYEHRVQVTVTADASGHSDETRVDLTSSDFPADYVFTSDGRDVRVVLASDDLTPVDHFVTGWDAVGRTGTVFIKLPAIPPNSSTSVFIYFGDESAASAGDVDAVFPASGLRLRSRVSTADPTDAASARAAFESATVDVYDQIRTSVSGLNNRALGGSAGDFGWCISAMIEVTSATAGVWDFRYGADFGRGGHLYVREVALEEDWNDDLWWANNFNNTAETLSGSISLDEGWHRYEAMGFEGCCDGAVGWQARAPGGAWQDMSSANFAIRGSRCVVTTASVTPSVTETCTGEPTASKAVQIISDPLGSPSPFAIPGTVLEYALSVENAGQQLSTDSVVLTDSLPPEISLIVDGATAFELVDGATSSGLTLDWQGYASLTDDVEFSTDGVNFGYIPDPDGQNADPDVTHVRFNPSGAMTAYADGVTSPSFYVRFQAVVR